MHSTLATPGDTSWFTRDRFGMFIHWGLYSMPARHEWVRQRERIPNDVYDSRYFRRFDPDLYDPNAWADAAAGAGMKYCVVTTKHHEGFCLWDSQFTDYKATNTPAGRDLLRPLCDAFRERGLRTGFYYSLLDWRHGDYVIDRYKGPYRDHPDREKMNVGRVQARYAQYMRDQVRELLTQYKPVDILWFDFSYPMPDGDGKGAKDWESEKLYALVRELAPSVILNDRLDLESGWDVKTPEEFQPRSWVKYKGTPVVWETCQTFNSSWGYYRDESRWRSAEDLIRTLIDTVSKGGNLLLNVGPTARGEMDYRALERLKEIGKWMHYHSRSIYGCTAAPADIPVPPDCRFTYNREKKRLYAHLVRYPYKFLNLDGLASRVEYAQFLHDGSEVGVNTAKWMADYAGEDGQDTLRLQLPTPGPKVTIPVIEMFLK